MTIVYATPDELEALSMGEEIAVCVTAASCNRARPMTSTSGRRILCRVEDRFAAHQHDRRRSGG